MAYCLLPITVSSRIVPCGKCVNCLKRKANDWYIRVKHEMRSTEPGMNNYHVTLTYNDENLPANNMPSKQDIQLFHKRLRKNLDRKMLYYLISEFGEKFGRVHYHGLYFNVPNSQEFLNHLEKSWNKGTVYISQLNESNIRYVVNHNITRDVKKGEFALMSRRPAIGKTYLETNFREMQHYVDICKPIVQDYQHVYSMPRYYKDKLFNDEQKEKIAAQCAEKAQERRDKYFYLPEKEYNAIKVKRVEYAFEEMRKLKKNIKRKKQHL